MAIWFTTPSIEGLNRFSDNTLISHIGIEFTEIGDDYISAGMPVDRRTHQPLGLLHGGASVALAETLASTGAYHCIDTRLYACVGLEINANHIRAIREGWVNGVGRPLHLGKTTQVWDVRIADSEGRLVCISRVTMAILSLGARQAP